VIKALVFDFDGLILETETPAYETWSEIYRERGHEGRENAGSRSQNVRCDGQTLALRLEESLRRLPFQKRLDESMKQIDLRDDGRV
jgi:beta-phosphoglucomutase-like phosphatase (HAD superfamily)